MLLLLKPNAPLKDRPTINIPPTHHTLNIVEFLSVGNSSIRTTSFPLQSPQRRIFHPGNLESMIKPLVDRHIDGLTHLFGLGTHAVGGLRQRSGLIEEGGEGRRRDATMDFNIVRKGRYLQIRRTNERNISTAR